MRYAVNENTAPTFTVSSTNTLNGTPTFSSSAVVLDADVQIVDNQFVTRGHYDGASLTLQRHGGANAQDVFEPSSGTLQALTEGGHLTLGTAPIGTVTKNSDGILTLTFNQDATLLPTV